MTIVAYPLDAVSGAPSYTGEMVRQTFASLLGPAPSGRPLGATSGVRPGTPTTTVTASSTTWTVAPHAGVLDLETSATAGAYLYAVKAAETGAMTAANATNPRIDIVYVKVNDPAESDGSSTPAVVTGYLAGTAAASPVAPATPARSMVLAQINVPVSGGGSPSVTWVAPTCAGSQLTAYAYGYTTAAQSFASGPIGVVNTWSPLTLNNLSYSSGTFTVIIPGFYRISAAVAFTAAASPSGIRAAQIQINGVSMSETVIRGDAGFALPTQVSWGQPLNTGDTISVTGQQSQGTNVTLSGFGKQNFVSISLTGNS